MIVELKNRLSFIDNAPNLQVEYDDAKGVCNGSKAAIWNQILKFKGEPGNWTISFKDIHHAYIWTILTNNTNKQTSSD